jgi:hypothetical protein
MKNDLIFASLTRISNLQEVDFNAQALPKEDWGNGDYVVVEVSDHGWGAKIELVNGRQMDPLEGERIVGALGIRHATLEATGTWREGGPEEEMELLTGAGLIGKMTSTSPLSPTPIKVKYIGHVMVNDKKARMADYAADDKVKPFDLPVILITGTSMSAGKTTVARVVVQQLTNMGHRVLGAKLTGAGRYRDVLAMKDAGAVDVVDFVDAGLPSSIVPVPRYQKALEGMLTRMAKAEADIAVVEIGASPYEPYNGSIAIEGIKDNIRFTVICTSDPYAVMGVMRGFDFKPDLVSGPCTNTIASTELVEKLTGVPALNLMKPENRAVLREMLGRVL